MHIKICGISNIDDALPAVQCGATHLGLIFVERSPRCVDEATARAIVTAVENKARVVGVFQNHDTETIAAIAAATGIDIIQLHGDEDAAFCRSIGLRTGKSIIKVITIDSAEQVAERLEKYAGSRDQISHFLFDRAKGNSDEGWLEKAIDGLSAMEKSAGLPPYFFAGGLTSENVGHVLSKINPSGVDVASGVEASPRAKDPAKIKAFIERVKEKCRTGVTGSAKE